MGMAILAIENHLKEQRMGRHKQEDTRDAMMAFIIAYRGENGISPSYREIEEEVGISMSSVFYHLNILEEDGKIRQRTHYRSRSVVPLEITTDGEDAVLEPEVEL